MQPSANRGGRFIRLMPLTLLLAIICIALPAAAKKAEQERTLLIINSYTENSSWARAMMHPIATHIASIDGVHTEVVHMNNVLVTDSASYARATHHIFEKYRKNHPEYVALIGYLAFTVRDSIKAQWGDDVPILFISRTENYFNGQNALMGYEYGTPVERPVTELRDKYNFTMVLDRDHVKETIDLMDKMIPDMDTLVFISDGMPINRSEDATIRKYLRNNYPGMEYRWIKTDSAGVERLNEYYVEHVPNTGLLLGCWNIVTEDTQSNLNAGMGEILNMYGSATPIFSLRQPHMDYGSVGGVYSDLDEVHRSSILVVDSMLAGASMHSLPFFSDEDHNQPILNYELLENYSLSPDNAPDDTEFQHRPQSFWEEHLWRFIAMGLVALIIIILLLTRTRAQATKIKTLRRHEDFVNHMPLPFSKADILFDNEGKVYDIEYTMHNESFDEMLRVNALPGLPTKIFPYEFIAEQTTQLMLTGKPVRFQYTFEKSGRTYDFLLCSVGMDRRSEKSPQALRVVDLFAIEITDRIKLENDLKAVTRRFDATINVSGLLPWIWYIQDDEIVFDAYSIDRRVARDLDNPMVTHDSRITPQEYINLLPEEDQHLLREAREDLLAGRTDSFDSRYRLKMARHGKDVYEWVAARGCVTEWDEDHKPKIITGAMLVITEFLQDIPADLDPSEE